MPIGRAPSPVMNLEGQCGARWSLRSLATPRYRQFAASPESAEVGVPFRRNSPARMWASLSGTVM